MRWPIRNQILLPFAMIQIITVVGIAGSFVWIAVDQVEEEISHRLSSVLGTLHSATYPLTPAILDQLRSLSDAQFIVLDESADVIASTLPDPVSVAAGLAEQPWQALGSEIVSNRQKLVIHEETYFAGRVDLHHLPGISSRTVLVLYPEQNWILARWQAAGPPVVIAGVMLLLTFLASRQVSRRIGNRIQVVQQQVTRIAAGDFQPVSLNPRNDELRDLSVAINRMAAALEESMRNIRETERSSLLRQLVGGLAHQLRNALTGARTAIQLHRRSCRADDTESIEVALRQLTLTEEQIKALLRLTRGEQRGAHPAGIREILEETVSLVRPICTHQKIAFEFSSGDVDTLVPDADAIRGALLNLIMNAIDAAGPHGRLSVQARRESADTIVIDVCDNGPGVPREQAEDVFAPFFTTKQEGVGLGLALARKATLDCHGTLTLKRTDGWTVFSMRLPRLAPANARSASSPSVSLSLLRTPQ